MPRFDGTGPAGSGFRTGRGRGQCGSMTGNNRLPREKGFGCSGAAWGGGRGRCMGGKRGLSPVTGDIPGTVQNETEILKTHIETAKKVLARMQARLHELTEED